MWSVRRARGTRRKAPTACIVEDGQRSARNPNAPLGFQRDGSMHPGFHGDLHRHRLRPRGALMRSLPILGQTLS